MDTNSLLLFDSHIGSQVTFVWSGLNFNPPTSFFIVVVLLGVHYGIHKNSYNISNISYLNSPLPSLSYIRPSLHSWNSFKSLFILSSNVVEILTDEKPSDTRRSGELRFYLMPAVPDGFTLLIWALSKGFTGYLKVSAGHQVTRNVLGLIGELVVS
jgi:hypothetical protein